MGTVEEGFGDRPGEIGARFGARLFRRNRQPQDTETDRLHRRRMFLGVIERLVGFVVVHRTVCLVVVLNAFLVLQRVHERGRAVDRRHAALHGETIQGQA